MTALIPLAFAATLVNPIVVSQWVYYPVREQARGYLGRYPDQPLLVDVDLPEDTDCTDIPAVPGWCEYNSMADINASYAEGKNYGLDGFAFFPERYRQLHWRAKDSSVKGMLTVPIVNFRYASRLNDDIAEIARCVKYGCSAKHGGKSIVLSYWLNGYNKEPAKLAEKLKQTRERIGDCFLYMAATSWNLGVESWWQTGRVDGTRLEKMKEHFRDMLRVADGILLDRTMSNTVLTNNMCVFAGGYHKIITQTARAVVNEPEFKGKKLLGFTLSLGHQNGYHQNFTANAMGTRTLRESFEAAIAGDPDIILIPEWDELNESTSWQPTLYNGYSTKRLFRHYDAVLRKRPQTVMEGDDTSIPNVILSYRKALSPGEWMYFEAVNVPDGSRCGTIDVSLELLDDKGGLLVSLPEKTLREDALDTAWWEVHSEELAPLTRAVDVRLSWRKGNAASALVTGFHPIDLAPANSWNLKDVKQALRDLAPVSCRKFTLKDGKVHADISCGVPIRHAMLCGNGWIQYIHNPASACSRFREDENYAVFTIASTREVAITNTYSYSVSGVPEAEWLSWKRDERGEIFLFDRLSVDNPNVFLRIPRTKLPKAKLVMDYTGVFPKAEVSLAEVSRLGSWAIGGSSYGCECAVTRFGLQSRYPSALAANDCSFAITPDADRNSMMCHLQVVTMDGKTWRSSPLVMERPGCKVQTVVQSALKGHVVVCELPRTRVPRLEYDFSPESGDVMRPISGERHFFGILGSTAALATLWNRGSSLEGPFPRGSQFWRKAKDTHPKHAKGDIGTWELVFDGVDDFVSFPQETVPQWAAASIDLEFCQCADGVMRTETLFTARNDDRVGLYEIILANGEVVISGYVMDPHAFFWLPFEFRTGLKAVPDVWHALNVHHTGSAMVVKLDDKSIQKPVKLPAMFMNTAILGGAPSNGTSFFTGKVRKLIIDHALSP